MPNLDLTRREVEILQAIANGMGTAKEIGVELCITEETVKNHILHISQKLYTHNKAASVAEGFRLGLIH